MFTSDDIRDRLQQRPFVPLRIVTSSAESFDVYHPDLILIGRNWVIVGTPSSDNPRDAERVARVALMHITALEDFPAPSPSGGNGRRSEPPATS